MTKLSLQLFMIVATVINVIDYYYIITEVVIDIIIIR